MEHYDSTDKEIFRPEVIRTLTDKTTLANERHGFSLEPFVRVYGMDAIKRDYSEVADKLIEIHEKKMSGSEKMGHIFEGAFLDVGNQGNWFGAGSELKRASKYDDFHGVDMVATIMAQDSSAHHLAIASDLTFSYEKLSDKFTRVIEGARRGRLATLRYFHSDLLHFTGELRNIPKTVVGLDAENLNKFLVRWIKEPELAQRQYGSLMLKQMLMQCETLSKVAGKDQPAARDAYRRGAAILRMLLEKDYKDIETPQDKLSNLLAKHCAKIA